MAEKADRKDDKKDAGHGDDKAAKKGGIKAMLTKLPVLLGGAMVIEAAILLVGVKLLSGGPDTARAAEVSLEVGEEGSEVSRDGAAKSEGDAKDGQATASAGEKVDPKKLYEVPVVAFRAPNARSGKTFLYDVSIVAVVKGKNKAVLENAIKERGNLLNDRIRTIIGQSEPAKLGASEPGLETLRRQVKYQLDEIVGEGIVDEVLVPRCTPFRTDF